MRKRITVLLFFIFISNGPPLASAREECSMYTPYEYQRMGGEYKIGPYPSRSECQSVNNSYFSGNGRCDCETIEEPSPGYSRGDSGPGYTAPVGSQPAEPDWNQRWQQDQERIRQERERTREREIEEKAKRDAEARRRELEWKQNKEKLISSLKGATPTDLPMKTGGEDFKLKASTEEVELKPKDTDFFDVWKKRGQSVIIGIKEKVLDRGGPGKQIPPSSESENLRRALWLYQKAAMAKNPEEARFLSEQADEAAQGHPLLVEVPPADKTPELSKEDLQQFERLATVFEKDRLAMDAVAQKRVNVEEKKALLQKRVSELKVKIQTMEQKPATLPSEPQAKPVPELKKVPELKEAPEVKKPKGGEDLRAEYEALGREMQKTNDEATRLINEEGNAKQALEKSGSNLDKFLGK